MRSNVSSADAGLIAAPSVLRMKPVNRALTVVLTGLVLLVSLTVVYALWANARYTAHKNLEAEFDFRVRDLAENIIRRMGTYEQVLRATQGMLNGSMTIEREAFAYYAASLRLAERHPGIQGVAITELIPKAQKEAHVRSVQREGFPGYAIWPEGERETYTSITHIEPFTEMNRRAFGFDMWTQPVRRAAMEQARDTGRPALSGRVVLVQEAEKNIQSGFLMYLPVYRLGAPLSTLAQRRDALVGWVYAPFRAIDFMAGLGGERSADLHTRIFDGDTRAADACLFGCAEPAGHVPLFKTTRLIDIAGHPWTIDAQSTPEFEADLETITASTIAVAGTSISFLLAVLVWMLAQGRTRAVEIAVGMTQELRSSNARLDAEQRRIKVILENTHDAFVAIDTKGRITDWNSQAERIFGWRANEAIGKNGVDLLIPPEQRAAAHERMARFLDDSSGSVRNIRRELIAARRGGGHFPVELSLAAVKVGDGYIANAFIRDISERKETERRETQRQKALDQARTALLHAQKLEAVGKLTGGVAHDFNNMLQIISGNMEMLKIIGGSESERERLVQNALNAVERGTKLSTQLLAFARRQPLEPRVVNPRRLLRNIDELLRQAVGEAVDIETVVGGGLWNTLVDPHQLENVILNLAINARDAMPGGGRLTIELENAVLNDEYVSLIPGMRAGQYVMLAVSDTGSGMAPEVAERAFEPFFTTKAEGVGTGLGLSMAYGFVKQSGGHIRIYSELGHGTTIRIYLPRSFGTEQEMQDRTAETLAGGSETVLVVEDDNEVRTTVVGMLGDLGYKVLQASDAQSALDIVEQGSKVDLLFTDVVMPGSLRSTELAKRAKEMLPELAVLFTSGYTQNAIVHGGRLDPGVELISKPYTRQQLARKVRQVLADRSQPFPPQAAAETMIHSLEANAGLEPKARIETPLSILVVEDNDDLRQIAIHFLRIMGHSAMSASTAEEGMKALSDKRIDVLLTDVNLPGMNGIQLAEKALAAQPHIEVIFATGYGDTLNGFSQKDPVVLTKPYHFAQLEKALATLQKTPAAQGV
ncbi:hypothetical protein GCM10027343_35520 [Noviherbaspirillum agri]